MSQLRTMRHAIRHSLASMASELDKRLAGKTLSSSRGTFGREFRVAHQKIRLKYERFLDNPVIDIAILVNMIQMGVSLEVKKDSWQKVFVAIEYVILGIFIVELLARLGIQGLSYFKNWMNWIDLIVVTTSSVEVVLSQTGAKLNDNISIIHLLRLLRLLRMVKLLRVFPQLKVILDALMESCKAMLWLVAFLGLSMYVFSILCVMLIGTRDAGYPAYNETVDNIRLDPDVKNFNNYRFFGTLARSMITLFHLSLLSDEMVEVIRGTVKVQPWVAPLFCAYILIATMCLMNTIVGVIVQRTMASFNEQQQAQDVKMKEQVEAVEILASIMFELDADRDGQLSFDEFAAAMTNDNFNQLLRRIEIPWGFTIEDLFTLLDTSCQGNLSKAEFTNGLFHLIFSSDFQRECRAAVSHTKLSRTVKEMHSHLQQHIDWVHKKLSAEIRLSLHHLHSYAPDSEEPEHMHVDTLRSTASTAPPIAHDTWTPDSDKCSFVTSTATHHTRSDFAEIMQSLNQAIRILDQTRGLVSGFEHSPTGFACTPADSPIKPCKGSFRLLHVYDVVDDDVSEHTVPLEARLRPSPQTSSLQDICCNAQVLGKPSLNEGDCSQQVPDPSDRVGLLDQ